MAPAYAVPCMLARTGFTLADFDFYEIHEAVAARVLCTLRAWESETFRRAQLGLSKPLGAIDRKKRNVVGGSIALGHPFGASGAHVSWPRWRSCRLEKGLGLGLNSICTAGGMGVTAILERP